MTAAVIVESAEQVVALIETKQRQLRRVAVVGVSGYAGSGKSTLVREIVALFPKAVRMRGDDFLDPARSHHRSGDWSGVERERLVSEVLRPFREGRADVFRRFDWGRRELGPTEPLPVGDILVVDLIGLFHPDALPVMEWDHFRPLGVGKKPTGYISVIYNLVPDCGNATRAKAIRGAASGSTAPHAFHLYRVACRILLNGWRG